MSDNIESSSADDAVQPAASVRDGFMIVGIGASAGGITAFREFFANVPGQSGMAYVVIIHLSPDHDSHLAEVLQQSTPMPVTQVTEQVRIEPDHVYVIPPNQSLSMMDGSLVLSEVTSIEERRAPVDIFFRTLADSHGARAACVVLSGTGANGSMGLKRVKEQGGVAFVQDPAEAEYPDMPRHSIATGFADYVLPVAEMPARLAAYRDSLSLVATNGHEEQEEEQRKHPSRAQAEEQALAAVLAQLRLRTGHDFSNYKRGTVRRRIERRISVTGVADLDVYALYIRENPQEARALLKDLHISVTNFFRDSKAFEALEKLIIPRLFEGKGAGGYVRVWVAGCATGEEAYSIAMLLTEHAEALVSPPSIQVFASDIDEGAVQTARAGLYTLNDVADVSPERLRRFFTMLREGYSVRRELRELVLFAKHDLLKDPPFSHLDMVSCRNLLIYLNPSGQGKAMSVFRFAINAGGYLFLGNSETVGEYSDLFVAADKTSHVYQARSAGPRPAAPMLTPSPPRHPGIAPAYEGTRLEARAQERLSYLDLHRRLLEMYAPPSVLVNAEHEIVHLSASAGRYLSLPGGEPSYNLLTVARPELRLELRGALYHAAKNHTSVEVPGLRFHADDGTEAVNLIVRPVVREDDTARGFFLVLFEPTSAVPPEVELVRSVEPAARQLEEELAHIKSQLRMTIGQYEVQHEELRATNEELQAMNEELRSSAEELETSKEELQSLNEELTTVNQELKNKIEELSQTNDDLQNLTASTDLATLFLDRSLSVKLFTPRARDVFNLISSDIGRPLTDITHKLSFGEFVRDVGEWSADVERVLVTLNTVEREVGKRDGSVYLMRLSPYRTNEDRILGVVLTFIDITERKRADAALREAQDSLELAFEAARMGMWDVDLTTGEARTALLHNQMFGYSGPLVAWGPEEFREHILPEDHEEFEQSFARALETGLLEFQVRVRWPDGTVHWIHDRGRVYYDEQGCPRRMAGITVDITERMEVEQLLQANEKRLRLLVDSAEGFGIFTTDAAGRIESWNTGAESIFGYTADEVIGIHAAIIFTPEDRARGADREEMQTARANGRASDERWHLRKDGSRFYASGVLSRLGDKPDSGFVKILRDLTAQRRADEELRSVHAELEHRVSERTDELQLAVEAMLAEVKERRAAEEHTRALVGQLVTAQEDERRRISRDLHDQLGQQLTALRLKLAALREACGPDEAARSQVEEVQVLAERIDSEVDFLAWELRPTALDDLGLVAALTNFVKEWSSHYHIPAEAHVTGFESGELRLSPQTETCLYRITQEALNNVYKHSQAARVSVILERRGADAVLVIEDDGVGFDVSKAAGRDGNRGLGLVGMRERAALLGGSVEFESGLGKGTTIFARVPADAKP